MKKIGILVYDDSAIGGAENVVIKLGNEFSEKFEVHMISLFQTNQTRIPDNVKHYIINSEVKSITFHLWEMAQKLKKYLKENKIDILFGITAGVNTVAILATKGTNIKTVYCEHSNLENKTYGKKHQLRQWLGAHYMDKVVALTERDRQNFLIKYKLSEDKVICIPNWFDKKENTDFIYKKNAKKIITAGRLEKVKGHDMLLKVAKLIANKHSDWHWDIYGDGKFKQEIEAKIIEYGLQKFITLKGKVSDLDKRYQDYAMFVLTSYYEGLPLVLLEAQTAKLPIVSFDCPTGPAEIVENNVNGFLVSCYDIEQMAKKINELIEDSEKREEFSNQSQKNFNKFKKDQVMNSWLKLIENL